MTNPNSVAVLREIEREMRELAASIARAGINGFGNHVSMLADRLATLHPAPPVADAVTEEMVSRACIAHDPRYYVVSEDTRCDMRERMRSVLTAALAARTGQGEANG